MLLGVGRRKGAHHSESRRLGADGRKGRIGLGAVHDGAVAMRVGLNLDFLGRGANATDEEEDDAANAWRAKQGFVDLNRC